MTELPITNEYLPANYQDMDNIELLDDMNIRIERVRLQPKSFIRSKKKKLKVK